MSDISDLLGGQYLSAENVQQPLLVTISGAERTDLDGQPRLEVQFAELQKPLLANKTNLSMLASLFGKDTTAWVGHNVVIQSEPVQFQGKVVQGLRVKPHQPQTAPAVPQQLAATAVQQSVAPAPGAPVVPQGQQQAAAPAPQPPVKPEQQVGDDSPF